MTWSPSFIYSFSYQITIIYLGPTELQARPKSSSRNSTDEALASIPTPSFACWTVSLPFSLKISRPLTRSPAARFFLEIRRWAWLRFYYQTIRAFLKQRCLKPEEGFLRLVLLQRAPYRQQLPSALKAALQQSWTEEHSCFSPCNRSNQQNCVRQFRGRLVRWRFCYEWVLSNQVFLLKPKRKNTRLVLR